MNCPKCGGRNNDTATFCKKCGTSLLPEVVCKKCGTKNEEDAVFCEKCGKRLKPVDALKNITKASAAKTEETVTRVREAAKPIANAVVEQTGAAAEKINPAADTIAKKHNIKKNGVIRRNRALSLRCGGGGFFSVWHEREANTACRNMYGWYADCAAG